jgi:hypothetical protein
MIVMIAIHRESVLQQPVQTALGRENLPQRGSRLDRHLIEAMKPFALILAGVAASEMPLPSECDDDGILIIRGSRRFPASLILC